MEKKPSEIRFSQKEIWHRFRRTSGHTHLTIGQTLDMIMNAELSVKSIPVINVKYDEEKDQWITADNRRLWVFQQLERLGHCNVIRVEKTYYIDSNKMSSENGGVSVDIKHGDSPCGEWHEAPDAVWLDPSEIQYTRRIIEKTLAQNDYLPESDVTDLMKRLKNDSTGSPYVPSIIVLRTSGSKKVFDGNKRLWAFKEANKRRLTKLKVRCIVFEEMDKIPFTLRHRLSADKTRIMNDFVDQCSLQEAMPIQQQMESLKL